MTASPGSPTTRSIAQGGSVVTGRRFDLAVVLDGERAPDARPMGRAIPCSTFHHFADINRDPGAAGPSFVTDVPAPPQEDRLTVAQRLTVTGSDAALSPSSSHAHDAIREALPELLGSDFTPRPVSTDRHR